MLNRQKNRRIWVLPVVGLFVGIQLFSIIAVSATAYAADEQLGAVGPAGAVGPVDPKLYINNSVTKKATTWVLVRAVEECLDANGVQNKDSSDEITEGDITAGEYVGRIAEGGGSNDAQVDCDPIWKAAHE